MTKQIQMISKKPKNTSLILQDEKKSKASTYILATLVVSVSFTIFSFIFINFYPKKINNPTKDTSFSESIPSSYESIDKSQSIENEKIISSVTPEIDLHDRDSQYRLGIKYLTGNGVIQDYKEAIGWLTLAANQDQKEAQSMLGQIYYEGEITRRNDKQAIIWSMVAAMKGVKESQYMVGLMYEGGRGIKKDLKEAYKWFKLSAEQGFIKAQEKVVFYEKEKTLVEKKEKSKIAESVIPSITSEENSKEINKYLSNLEKTKKKAINKNKDIEIILN